MRNVRLLAVLATVALAAAGCKGDKGDNGAPGNAGGNGSNGTNGTNGLNALVATSTESAGANCAAGGTRIQVGIDTNANGTLDAAEVTGTTYACNGAAGSNGSNGSNGTNGLVSLVVTSVEARGANCAGGGVKIDSGLDANASGVLDVAEILSTRYVCNGGGRLTEACAACHNPSLARHAPTGQVVATAGVVALANANADLAVTFNIKVDGFNNSDFWRIPESTRTPGTLAAYRWVFAAGAGTRTALNLGDAALVSLGNGNYRITLPGFGTAGANAALVTPDSTAFLFNIDQGNTADEANRVGALVATVVAPYTVSGAMPGVPVNGQACMNCHGNFVFKELGSNGLPLGHHSANPVGVNACVICHDRDNTAETRLGVNGTRLMGYVHGIHNSHNMPGAVDTAGVAVAGRKYYRNGSATSTFSIGFPGYMNNCSTCHFDAALPAIAATPVSWFACMSCHVGPPTTVGPAGATQTIAAGFAWAGFGVPNTGTATAPIFSFNGANHANFTGATVCGNCHDGAPGNPPATLAGFHNGLKTERNGLIFDGADQSVIEGAKFALAVTGVTRVGTNYQITWTAQYDSGAGLAAVDPCNTDFALGPVFLDQTANAATGRSASNMQFVKAYGQPAVAGVAQGDDWVNANRTGTQSPGQPITSATLTAAGATPNTVCAGNVATTTTPVDPVAVAPDGTKGVMALQGKPQVRFAAAAGTTGEFIQARAKSPTYNFLVQAADGAAAAGAARRVVVDTAKCLKCHKGTLYQHGGNRVDNVDLCITCHNPASSETNVRIGMGVTAAEAYDGRAGQSYDMRTMAHAIHSAGETGKSYVIYRTRGIYFFGNPASFADAVANRAWPTTGGVSCVGAEGPVTYYRVAGSLDTPAPVPNADGTCPTVPSTSTWQIHNVTFVEYPQPLNNCYACHADGWTPAVTDPSKAVAVTDDAGVAPFGNQLDDVLQGPTAASCTSCHRSGDPLTQFQLQLHVSDQGFAPSTFFNGRQTLLDVFHP